MANERILVADDEMDIRMIVEAVLQGKGGYSVDTVNNAQEAIDKLVKAQEEQKPYAAVVTDLRMPKDEGLDVLLYVREHYGDTPVVVLSANIEPAELREVQLKKAYFLEKPFENLALSETVAQAIGEYQLQKSRSESK